MMDMWEVYYRYRKNYEQGGPWVYIRTRVTTTRTDEDEIRRGILSHLQCSEVVTMRKLYPAGTILLTGDCNFGKVVKAGEANEARDREDYRRLQKEVTA